MYDRSIAERDETRNAALDSRRENDIFHSTIAELSGNSRLARSIDEINETFPRNVSAQLLVGDSRHREENFHEHSRILDALERGDAEAARNEMREHVIKAGEQLARWYERRSSTVFKG
jgi:DNA-binding GntR family transcriptional regulator